MSESLFDIVPAERRDAARAAVAEAMGLDRLEQLERVSGGASGALVFRLVAGGRPWLLRLELQRDYFRDPHRSFACMRAAAEAGLAPPLLHADPDAGAAVMQFMPEQPLATFPGGPAALVRALGELVGRLHALEPFAPLADYPVLLDGMLTALDHSGVFAPGLLEPHVQALQTIREAYRWDEAATTASHNDPNPRNILYDGERLWLVDWELAFRNDPLVDVAILANDFAGTPELETVLLASATGGTADGLTRARLALMRPLARLYYATIVLSRFAAVPRAEPDADLTAPTPAEFRAMAMEGRLKPGAETAWLYGKMQLAAFLAASAAPGFDEALATARAG